MITAALRVPTMPTRGPLAFTFDDGGRAAAGYRGFTRDCGARAIAIVTGMGYQHAYDLINEYAKRERPRGRTKRSHARTGVHQATMKRIMADLGWEWVPTMTIGSGTTVHLTPGELPTELGPLMIRASRHFTAVIDGVVHDTHDPSRGGTRAVYGYWAKGAEIS